MTAPDPLVDTRQAAALLCIDEGTLANWRCSKRYDLPFVKVGNRVRYRMSDIEAFSRRHTNAR